MSDILQPEIILPDNYICNVKPGTLFTEDNLKVMRGINSNSIDFIYGDPPYNTDEDWGDPLKTGHFKDTWSIEDVDRAWVEQIKEVNPAVTDIINLAEKVEGEKMMAYISVMSIRLIETHRILKPTGSTMLQCDDSASHFLKLLLDAIFGPSNCINVCYWKRFSVGKNNASSQMGRMVDTIFYYKKSNKYKHKTVYLPYTEEYIEKTFRENDENGRYKLNPLTHNNAREYEFNGITRRWRWKRERMIQAEADNLLVQLTPGGPLYYKMYLSNAKGIPVQNLWTDIKPPNKKEKTGYPTQKPIELLSRCIKMTTDPGDLVLDNYAGCCTTVIAAEIEGRNWIGVDISPKAISMVKERRENQLPGDINMRGIRQDPIFLDKPPIRTDLNTIKYNSPENKWYLFDLQKRELTNEEKERGVVLSESICMGCAKEFEYRNFAIDHIIPQDHEGSTDNRSNLQLLCGACNSSKSNRTYQQLLESNIKKEIITERQALDLKDKFKELGKVKYQEEIANPVEKKEGKKKRNNKQQRLI